MQVAPPAVLGPFPGRQGSHLSCHGLMLAATSPVMGKLVFSDDRRGAAPPKRRDRPGAFRVSLLQLGQVALAVAADEPGPALSSSSNLRSYSNLTKCSLPSRRMMSSAPVLSS